MNSTISTPHIGSHDDAPKGVTLPMTDVVHQAPAEEPGRPLDDPNRRSAAGPSVDRYDWADTFSYHHQVGMVARAVLVHFAHRGGPKHGYRVWEARETTAAHLQCSSRSVTKAVKLLVNLGALIPDGKKQNLNGQHTEIYKLGGQHTEWLVASEAQVEAVNALRGEPRSPKQEVIKLDLDREYEDVPSETNLEMHSVGAIAPEPSYESTPAYNSSLGERGSPLLVSEGVSRHESYDELRAMQQAAWEKTLDLRSRRRMAARL